jgi:Fic family protein
MHVAVNKPSIVDRVAKVHALSSVIRGIPIPPHVQTRLDHLNILRAVRGTTGIEGSELSEEEVAAVLKAPTTGSVLPGNRSREEREVRNAETLMYRVAELLNEDPNALISERLIREFHEIITADIDYPHNVPGSYRSHAATAGNYLPPETAEEVRRLMAEFIEWFNGTEPAQWDPVIQAIVAHFYTISIHPFGDGNGRTSRAVESFLLYKSQVNARGFYSLANYYYRNRTAYVETLDHVRFRSDPDLTPFVEFALTGLVDELQAVHDEVLAEVRVISFRDFARETLLTQGKLGTAVGERQFLFLLMLGEQPVSLKQLRDGRHELSHLYSNVTTKTLMRDIRFLEQHDLVIIQGDDLRANLEIMTQFMVARSGEHRASGHA